MDSLIAKARADIDRYGWHVLTVAGGDGGTFAFSIGLFQTFKHPEILVTGLAAQTAKELINVAGKKVPGGGGFKEDVPYLGLLEGYACRFRPVPKTAYSRYLGTAVRFYGSEDFPCTQLVWPNREGQFPRDSAATNSFRRSQPVPSE
jgi:hypothetical protein